MEKIAESREGIEAKTRQLREDARAKAASILRKARGIDEPEPKKAPETPQPEAKAAEPATPPAEASSELMKRIEARIHEQQSQAAARLEAAQKAQAAADAKMAELAAAAKNPVEFLEKNGIDLDAWQARLLNGGEATAEEKAKAALEERIAKAEARVAEFEKAQSEGAAKAQHEAAVNSLREPLKADFPLVNRFMGPEAALQHLRKMQSESSTPIDAKLSIAELEKGFKEGLLATLQDPAIANILPYSPKTPVSEQVAPQGPRTITNSVTSSTVPSPSGRTSLAEKRAIARKVIAQMRGS